MITEQRSMHNTYTAFGLNINATFTIPALTVAVRPSHRTDITISCGRVPNISAKAKIVKQHAWVLEHQVWLDFKGVGRFWINKGKEIVLEKYKRANDNDMQYYLLGAALACVLVQRNILPLHGCGIVSGEKAVLFLGATGSGKSTLAASLQQLGYAILSDDICAVSTASEAPPRLRVAYPQMKLGQPSLDYLGISHNPQHNLTNRRGKSFFPLSQSGLADSYPIERIYYLQHTTQTFIKKIPKSLFLPQLITNTHRKAITQNVCGIREHFQQCTYVLNQVNTYCFSRPFDFNQFQTGISALNNHLSRCLAG